MDQIIIPLPAEFNFDFCLQFLRRSPKEILHRVNENKVTKAIRLGRENVLFSLEPCPDGLLLSFSRKTTDETIKTITAYVRQWLDLDVDLKPFYRMARKDELLKPLVTKYRGHRIMSYPDLFESMVWAVLGQQINLAFAYTLKQRFVECFGERIELEGQVYHLFPLPERVVTIPESELLRMQFSRQKAAYTINIARAFVNGEISREKLAGLTLDEAKEILMKIKGVGNWTANYALMRTFRYPDAFPLEDAGLHNALKARLGLRKKPSIKRVKSIFKKYKGWEAYATVYLWKSL